MLADAMGEADLASDWLAGSVYLNARHPVFGGRCPGELWYQRDPEPLRDKARRDGVVRGLKRDLWGEPCGRTRQLESDAVWVLDGPGDEHFTRQVSDLGQLLIGESVGLGDHQFEWVLQHRPQSDSGGRRPGHAWVSVSDDSVDIAGGELRESVWWFEMKQGQLKVIVHGSQPVKRVR